MSGEIMVQRQRAKEIFLQVLELPDAHLPAAIHDRCEGDPALAELVAGLLRAHREAGRLLEPLPALADLGSANGATPAATFAPGDRVGSYRLARVIGEGGFGVVFLAEQDEPIRRRVALKVIKPGMDSAQVAARFAAERQALAMMDHPGIARVLDAGTTENGRPYFVMEFVDGPHLTDYCDGQRLTLQERLVLFHEVCLAVQHAHQKGVIHRDLKPSNVLVASVDGRPLPKVIDFGIAKAMGPALGDATATMEGQMIGTPECMAPEQIVPGGEDVDTRADVYALGVLLYRLLAGASPYEKALPRGDLLAWSRAIRDDEPARPSTRVRQLGAAAEPLAAARHTSPERLPRQLRGELDWIVLRAMAKDRGRRYPTAAALAADVRRFLDDETVEATPPSQLYKLGKLWRRYRAASLSLVTVIFASVAAAIVSVSAAYEARKAQQIADGQRSAAEHQAYFANLLAADVALRSNYTAEALRCLSAAPPARRGWEWHHMAGRADASLVTVRGGPGRALGMATHPTQPLFATAWEGGELRVLDLGSGEVRSRLPAGSDVESLAFTGDGGRVVFGTAKGRIAIWTWATGECQELAAHAGRVEQIALAGGGRLLATASWDGSAAVHDLTAPATRHVLRHDAAVHLVAMTGDGKRVATASWDESLQLWDATTGGLVKRLRVAHASTPPAAKAERFSPGNVMTIAFDPSGRWLAVSVRDSRLLVIDVETGEVIWSTSMHTRVVRSLAWTADGSRLAAASQDRRVTLWSTADWRLVTELSHADDVRAVTFTPDDRYVVSTGFDRTLRLWNASDGRPRGTLLGHEDGIFEVQATPDGRLLTHSGDGTVRAWNPSDATRQVLWGHECNVTALTFLGEDRLVSTGGNEIRHWDLGIGEPERIERFDPGTWLVALARDASGDRLATADVNGVLSIRSSSHGAVLPPIAAHQARIRSLAFSPDGRVIATAAEDDTVRLWDARSGARLAECRGHQGDVSGVAFALGGGVLVTSGMDGEARTWEAGTGRLVRKLAATRPGGFEAVAVHPDGNRLALATGRRIWLMSLRDHASRMLDGHGDTVRALAWFPDGTRLVSGSWDRSVRVWEPESGTCLLTLHGHGRQVTSLAVSPSGRRIAAGSEDCSVRVWEVPETK